MRIKIFNEAKQVGEIYHVCAIDSMKHIAETNTLESKQNNLNKKFLRYDVVSFTRNKQFICWTRSLNDFLFRIKVDGNKLSERYKITPYNDFFDVKNAPIKTQFEECVIGSINNFSDYIISVEFTYTDKFFENLDEKKFVYYLMALKQIDWFLESNNIECTRVSFPKDTEGYAKVITSRGISVRDPTHLTKKQREKIARAKAISSELTNISLQEFTDELIINFTRKNFNF